MSPTCEHYVEHEDGARLCGLKSVSALLEDIPEDRPVVWSCLCRKHSKKLINTLWIQFPISSMREDSNMWIIKRYGREFFLSDLVKKRQAKNRKGD